MRISVWSLFGIMLLMLVPFSGFCEQTASSPIRAFREALPPGVTCVMTASDVPAPELYPPPKYHNADTLRLYWKPIADTAVYERYYYYIEYDRPGLPGYDWVVMDIATGFSDLDTSAVFSQLPEDSLFFRVYAGFRRNDSLIFGDPSEVALSIVDRTAPVLDSIVVLSIDGRHRDYTTSQRVYVQYWGSDVPYGVLDSLLITEDAGFMTYISHAIDDDSGEVIYTLSEHSEWKTVFGRLIDRAGNISNDREASIMYVGDPHGYPNPFNPEAGQYVSFVYHSPDEKTVTIRVFDLFGHLVYHAPAEARQGLNDGISQADFRWNGRNDKGEIVANGGYLCIIECNGREPQTIKIAVVK